MTDVLDTLDVLDRALVAHGWPALSPWWRETFERFVQSGCRQLVARVGRRGGKSSSLSRFAVAFALAYPRGAVPPGDVGVVAFISTARDEASQRIRTIRAILDALGIGYRPIEHGIELSDRPVAFKVFVATIAGVSGFTSILVIADEVAKWRDSDSGANPATEVLASVRPTMATQSHARIVLSSSPLGTEDAHARAFDEGDTDFQVTAFAPTWVANPTVSEAETHRLEPDARVWAREYAAEPQGAKLAAFDPEAIARAFVPRPLGQRFQRFGVIDASSGKKDSWTYAVAGWAAEPNAHEARVLVFDYVAGYEGSFWQQRTADEIVRDVSRELRSRGCSRVFGDQRESFALSALFTRHGLTFEELPWTAPRKERAVGYLRSLLRDGRLFLPPHERLRAELRDFEERISPSSGALTFGARGAGHDDYVALLLTAAMADLEAPSRDHRRVPGSPTHANRMAAALFAAIDPNHGTRPAPYGLLGRVADVPASSARAEQSHASIIHDMSARGGHSPATPSDAATQILDDARRKGFL